MINLVYISQIYDVYFTTNLKMINLVYTSQIYYDYISHQSCISHLNDKPDIYIYIMNWNVCWGLHLLHLFKGVAAASSSSSRLLLLWWLSGSVVGFKVYIYVCVYVWWPDKIVYIYIHICKHMGVIRITYYIYYNYIKYICKYVGVAR